MKDFIQEVERMTLSITNVITYLKLDQQHKPAECLNWTVSISYSLQSFASVEASLFAHSLACVNGEEVYM